MRGGLKIVVLFFTQIVFSQTRQDTLTHFFSINEIKTFTKTQFILSVSDNEPSFVIAEDLVLPKGVKLYLFPDSILSGKKGKLNVYVNRRVVTDDVLSILLHNKNDEHHTVFLNLVFEKEKKVASVTFHGQLIDKESNKKLLGKMSIVNLQTDERVAFWTGMEGEFHTASLRVNTDYLICVTAPQCKMIFDTLKREDHIEEVLTKRYFLERFHEGDIIPLDHTLFRTGQAVITSSSYDVLDGFVMMMKLDPEMKVRIDGYVNNSVGQAQEITLSRNRAESVRKYLMEHQIDGKRVIVKGRGLTEGATKGNKRDIEFVVLQL